MLRGRLITWALFAVWAPLAVAVVLVASSVREPAMTCLAVFQVGAAAAILLAARRALRGFLVIGISGDVFRKSLQSALARLGLPYEETVIGFRLASLHDTLRTSLAPRLGSAQFLMESSEHRDVLAGIARWVEEFLRVSVAPPATAPALAAYQAQRF
jgi:hypothetical protein